MQARDFIIEPVYDEATVARAVDQNSARGLPSPIWNTQSGPISVCGNGPSLRDTFPREGKIAALNGAWKTLVQKGVMPDYIIAFDPAPQNVAWFEDAPDEPVYLLASCMDPAVFDLLKGKKVQVWHGDGEAERKHSNAIIGGGFTIGCVALHLLWKMGYRHFDLYGYDSSYALDGAHHATPQNWNIEPPQVFTVGERSFLAEPWMAAQVQELLKQVEQSRFNYTVAAKCDGLFPAALKHNTLEIVYDLDVCPGSFDFFCSMANAENFRKANGYSRAVVCFRRGNGADGFRTNEPIYVPHAYKTLMMNNVVRPLLKIFAFEEVESVSDNALQFQYSPVESLEHYRRTGEMAFYRESAQAREWAEKLFADRPYVITLREAEHWPQRNNKIEEWVKFAKTLDRRVIFVRDTVKAFESIPGCKICPEASMDVHKRLALYRMATMNYTVATGPAIMMCFSKDIPYLQFFTDAPDYPCYERSWIKEHWGFDEQYPWAGPRQANVFADDTFENILTAHRKIMGEFQQAAE